jgi:hypothetical protein
MRKPPQTEDQWATSSSPLVSNRAVLYICGTVLLLAGAGLVAFGMYLKPDHAPEILGGLAACVGVLGIWGSLTY